MNINSIFFSILSFGAGLTDRIELPAMNRSLWVSVLSMAQKQAVLGIVLDAVNKLPEGVNRPDRDLLMRLIGFGMEIERKNRMVNKEIMRWKNFFTERGFRSVLLKGQGVADFYPNPLHRNPGDIDLWVIGNTKEVRNVVCGELKAEDMTYHHIGVHEKGNVELEVHTTPSWMYSYPRNKVLQKLFREWSNHCQEISLSDEGKVSIPSDEMNRVFLLVHMYRHVLSEGIGLRQMMDYALLLKRCCSDAEREIFCNQVKRLNMYRFTGAVMFVMREVFGLDDDLLLVPADVKRGRKLLDSIMEGGNFGHYDKSIDKSINSDSAMSFLTRNKRNLKLLMDYPEEVMWGPLFKLWHYIWRKINN